MPNEGVRKHQENKYGYLLPSSGQSCKTIDNTDGWWDNGHYLKMTWSSYNLSRQIYHTLSGHLTSVSNSLLNRPRPAINSLHTPWQEEGLSPPLGCTGRNDLIFFFSSQESPVHLRPLATTHVMIYPCIFACTSKAGVFQNVFDGHNCWDCLLRAMLATLQRLPLWNMDRTYPELRCNVC